MPIPVPPFRGCPDLSLFRLLLVFFVDVPIYGVFVDVLIYGFLINGVRGCPHLCLGVLIYVGCPCFWGVEDIDDFEGGLWCVDIGLEVASGDRMYLEAPCGPD
jgi:hypothetical protein